MRDVIPFTRVQSPLDHCTVGHYKGREVYRPRLPEDGGAKSVPLRKSPGTTIGMGGILVTNTVL